MWAKHTKQSAFTIVELLIVIVVIGILAAITIVAYSGITTRAENAVTISAVEAYNKALTEYAIEHGSYPTAGGMCLGGTYPMLDGTTAGCRNSASVISNSSGAASRDLLRPYLGGQLPMPSTKILYNSGGIGSAGIYFYGTSYGITLNGETMVALMYTVNSSTCSVGPVYSMSGYPTITGSPVSRSSVISTDASLCMMLLPDALRF